MQSDKITVHKFRMTCDGCERWLLNPNTGKFFFDTTEQVYEQARRENWTRQGKNDWCPCCVAELEKPGRVPTAAEFCSTECWSCSDLTCIHNTRRQAYYKPKE